MNHYETLGLTRHATPKQITKAFRRLALKWHPDKNPDNKEKAEKLFKEINTAYSVLGNPIKKQEYDASLEEIEQASASSEDAETSSEEKKSERRGSDPTEEDVRRLLDIPNLLFGQGTKPKPTQEDIEQTLAFLKFAKQMERRRKAEEKEKARRKGLGQQLLKQIKQGEWDSVEEWVAAGAFLNERDDKGLGAVHYVTLTNNEVGLQTLLRLGADINLQDTSSKTPLHHATLKNDYTWCRLLVHNGAERHHQTYPNKDTPLHLAIEHRQDQRIQNLFINNVSHYYSFFIPYSSLDMQDVLGDTPLHLAVKTAQFDTALGLLEKGAKVAVRNKNKQTALDLLPFDAPAELRRKLTSSYEEENQSNCLLM